MMDSKQQDEVTVTAAELETLKLMPIDFPWMNETSQHVYDVHKTAIDNLVGKKLIRPTLTHYKLLDAGRKVLASAEEEKPTTITAGGWYYSSVAQWIPECSKDKINGYDGPFETWQTALEALFKEVNDDIDSYRADLARMQVALAKAEAKNAKLLSIIAAYDEYTGGDCPFCEGTGEAAVGFDDNPNVYETIFEECKDCRGSGKVAEALQAAIDDAAAGERGE